MVQDSRPEVGHDRSSERMDFRPHGDTRSRLNEEATDLRRNLKVASNASPAPRSFKSEARANADREETGDSLTIPSIDEVIGGGAGSNSRSPRTGTTDGGPQSRISDNGTIPGTTDGGSLPRTTDRGTTPNTTDSGSLPRAVDSSTRTSTADGGTPARNADNGSVSSINLDTNQSIEQLIKSGTIKRNERAGRLEEIESRTQQLREGDKPTIEVRFAEPQSEPSQIKSKADFTVASDGSIEVLNNPELTKDGHIVIELARPADPTAGPTPQQQESVDQLTAYLFERLPKSNEGITPENLTIDDKQGLLSPELKQALDKDLLEGVIAPETQQQIERMNRLPSQGSMTASDAGQYFPERDVPRQVNETDKVAAGKDTIAALFNPDKEAPYETVREPRGDSGYRVGRYGFSYELFADWLQDLLGGDLDLEDPAQMAKAMQKLAAKGKVPKDFAAKFNDPAFAKRFGQFMTKMKTGEGKISKEEVKEFLPKELQETIGADLVGKYSKATGGDIGKVAVAFQEGKPPEQLTGEDYYSKPANQAIAKAAREYERLAQARQQAKPNQDIGFARGPTSELEFKILDAAKSDVGKQMWAQSEFASWTENGNLGCAASVSEVLQQVGFDYANSAGVGNLTDQLKAKGWTQVPLSEAHAGDVVYGSEPGTNMHVGGGNAHIGIVGENGRVYHNSSSQRMWVEGDLAGVFSSNRFGNQRYALRPPDLSNA